MKKTDVHIGNHFGSLLAVLGLALASGTALAQSSAPREVVEPSIVVRLEPAPITAVVRTEQISYTQVVEYGDLDLSKPSDVVVLKRRVLEAAKAGCAEIDHRYPSGAYAPAPRKQNCIESATNSAAAQVAAAVAATRKYGGL